MMIRGHRPLLDRHGDSEAIDPGRLNSGNFLRKSGGFDRASGIQTGSPESFGTWRDDSSVPAPPGVHSDLQEDLSSPTGGLRRPNGLGDVVEREPGADLGGQDSGPRIRRRSRGTGAGPRGCSAPASSGRARTPRRTRLPAISRAGRPGSARSESDAVDEQPAVGGQRLEDAGADLAADRVEGVPDPVAADRLRGPAPRSGRRWSRSRRRPRAASARSMASGRRTTLSVLKPSCLPSRMTILPRLEPPPTGAASPRCGTARTCRTIASTVAGLTKNEATCSSGRSAGTGRACRAGITAYSAQLPPALLMTVDPLPHDQLAQQSRDRPCPPRPRPRSPGVAGELGSTP